MFDLKTFKVLGRAHAAEDADAILYDPVSDRVFSLNGDAHSSTVVDPNSGKVVANIPLGGKPEYGVSGGDGKVYANLTDISEVVVIDARKLTVVRRWSTAPCKQPVAMAIDRAHHRLFSGCRSGVMAVSDIGAGKVVATVPIGTGTDGAAFDPASGDAFASNADGTLTIIHQDSPDALSCRAEPADGARRPEHGTRSRHAQGLRGGRNDGTGAGGIDGRKSAPSPAGAAGVVPGDGDREVALP